MPWRTDVQPYYILVSEMMLQQTQVARVIPKFDAFIARFPTIDVLARSSLSDVVELWSGLGYNRRARYLWQAAQMIVDEFEGVFPYQPNMLQRLPGVGVNTAGAIATYAFNRPVYFIETNIRTVYIHHFFSTQNDVDDLAIISRLQATLDQRRPREFYWALMDYGSWLKAAGLHYNSRSRHYKKQAPLEGSVRQMRGMILRCLIDGDVPRRRIESEFSHDVRYMPAIEGLMRDGLIEYRNEFVGLTKA